MLSLPDIARATVARYSMLPSGAVVVAMVSGGADSISLLRLLADGELGSDLILSALHVNHGLRGEESDGDEQFVRETCEALGVPLRVEQADVAGFAVEHGLNLEDAGRQIRYERAHTEADARSATAGIAPDGARIAVAHTRSDRTETFLMRLAQGAGAAGLTTLKPVRGRIVRPLIEASREDVRDHLALLGQPWREDATNADTSRLRARVRHDLLPVMRDINPRFDESLARTLAVLAEEDLLLDEMASAFARDFARAVRGERVEFGCDMMATLSLPMRRRTIRRAVIDAFPEASRLEFEHVEALVGGMEVDGFARDLPGGLRAEVRYGTMSVSRTVEGDTAVAPGLLFVPGTVYLGPAGELSAEPVSPSAENEGPDVAVIDAADLSLPLLVTAPADGDRVQPLGMSGSKKVSDLFIDEKVPRARREGTPIVRNGDEIVWVAGVRMSEPYKVTSSTRAAVRLSWKRHSDVADGVCDDERNETTDAS